MPAKLDLVLSLGVVEHSDRVTVRDGNNVGIEG